MTKDIRYTQADAPRTTGMAEDQAIYRAAGLADDAVAAPVTEKVARLTKQGNSTGVTLAKEVLEATGLARGDDVVVAVQPDGSISLTPARSHKRAVDQAMGRVRGRYDWALKQLAK